MNTEALTTLAEAFDAARIQANAQPETEAQRGVYGHAAAGLEETLTLLTGSTDGGANAYTRILDGATVREALRGAAADAALDAISAETEAQQAIDAALALPTTLAAARAATRSDR